MTTLDTLDSVKMLNPAKPSEFDNKVTASKIKNVMLLRHVAEQMGDPIAEICIAAPSMPIGKYDEWVTVLRTIISIALIAVVISATLGVLVPSILVPLLLVLLGVSFLASSNVSSSREITLRANTTVIAVGKTNVYAIRHGEKISIFPLAYVMGAFTTKNTAGVVELELRSASGEELYTIMSPRDVSNPDLDISDKIARLISARSGGKSLKV